LSETPTGGPTVLATARIRAIEDGRFELVLTTEVADAHGTKTLDAGSCTALADAAAVFLALAIDSSTVSASPPASSEPASEKAPPQETPVAAVFSPRRPPPPPPPREPLRVAAGLGAAVDVGTLPNASAGLAIDVQARLGRMRAGVLATAWLPQRPIFDDVGGAGATLHMFGAGVFGCYVVPLGRVGIGPCANIEATFAEGSGVGIRHPMVARSVWPTAVAGVLADVRLTGWLALVARADGRFALGAPDVALATPQGNLSLYHPAVFAGRFGAGLEFVLP
jgi:hypothetical protein